MGPEVGGDDVLVGLEKAPGCLVRRATPLRKVLSPRQGIGDGVASSGAVDDDEVEAREELGPAGLTAGEGFGGGKVLKRLVIGVDGERRWVPFAVMAPLLETLDDRQHFLVMDLVVEFGRVELARVEGDRAEWRARGGGALREDAGDGEVG